MSEAGKRERVQENEAPMAGAAGEENEEEAELAAVKAKIVVLKKELEDLDAELRKYTVKPLHLRDDDEKAEISRLSDTGMQLYEQLNKLQDKKLKLMDVREAKRGRKLQSNLPEKLILQDYRLRDKGPSLTLCCVRGHDFFEEANRLVRGFVDVAESQEICLCVYASGIEGRIKLTSASAYWELTVVSCIFFWIGERPESFTTAVQRLTQDNREFRERLWYLEVTSANARVQEGRWKAREGLGVEVVEAMFPVLERFDCEEVSKVMSGCVWTGENVRDAWCEGFGVAKMGHVIRDCRKPNGIPYDGQQHEIDFVLSARTNVLAMEYIDTPVELKKEIVSEAKRRTVVLQLLSRMKFVFETQSSRTECWGVGLDGSHVLFVRCKRDLSYSVTQTIDLWTNSNAGAKLFFGLLGAPPAARGYSPVVLPNLWGKDAIAMLSKPREVTVFRLEPRGAVEVAAKVGPKKEVEAEWAIAIRVHTSCPGLVCPLFVDAPSETGHAKLPWGFTMSLQSAVVAGSEEEVCEVLGDVFWCLGVLHAIGLAHNDVKPANILRANGGHVLCDFGNSLWWKEGDPMCSLLGATEQYNVIRGGFAGSASSMFACDMEGLFWTILALWLQAKERQDAIPRRSAADRRHLLDSLRVRGGVWLGEDVCSPTTPMMIKYFEQAKTNVLLDPLDLFAAHVKLFDGEEERWIERVALREVSEYLPRCRPAVLSWLLKIRKR